MAIVSVKRVAAESGGIIAEAGGATERWEYLVQVDSLDDRPLTACYANDGTTAIPLLKSTHPNNGLMYCKAVDASRDPDNWEFYVVTVTWAERTFAPEEEKPEGTGVKWNVDFSVSGLPWTEVIYKDNSSPQKDILNSAKQRFENQPELTYYDEVIRVSYYTDVVPDSTFVTCRGKVNSATVSFSIGGVSKSYTARKLKLVNAEYGRVYQDGEAYWQVALEFNARQDSYITKILDQGYYTWDSSASDWVEIKDKDGNALNTPALLNSGLKATAPVYLEFKLEKEADLNTLFTGLS